MKTAIKQLGCFRDMGMVRVNLKLGFKGLLRAANLSWEDNPYFTPLESLIEGRGVREAQFGLFKFKNNAMSPDDTQQIEKAGYMLEDLAGLLAFAAAYPIEQCPRDILALGSPCRDDDCNHCAPYIYKQGKKRLLGICWIDCGYDKDWLLVSRKTHTASRRKA